MASISVIIPNYNRSAVIGETIENMLNQSLPPHEVIVVDDGSTDESVQVIQRFGDRVILIQQSNQGPGAARNTGLRVATGELIQFMDSDDLASRNKLEVQAKILKEQNADLVYGPWAKAWLVDQQLRLQDVVLQQRPLPGDRSPLFWFLTSWSMVFQQCLVRKSLIDRVGGYREDMQLYEDGELFVRILVAGAKLVHESETLTLYRLEDHGKLTQSGSHTSQKIIDKAHFYALVVEQISKHPELKYLLEHPEVCSNLAQAVLELEKVKAPVPDWMLNLHTEASCHSSFAANLKTWLKQKQGGLQNRLQGHRWHYSYQPRQLTPKQKDLVKELGFSLV